MTFSHHMASVNGIQIHYVIGGQGDPIVLLHGWPETWYEWRHVMPALAKNYTVIAPDLRGLGDSSKPPAGYDGKTTAEDIHQLVSQLGFKDILLVGHDFGVQVAYSYAAAHSAEVRRLVILDVPIPGIGPGGILCAYGGLNFIWYGIFQKCSLTDTKDSTLLGSTDTHVILLQSQKTILTNMSVTILFLVGCEPDLNTIGLYLTI
jgi:pimeloyl-ACP methyl ester carboxylesterase